MFAYCNNNPAAFKDIGGTAPWPTTKACNDGAYGYPIYSNIANTPRDQISGVINGQGLLPYSNSLIGLGTYGFSGCPYIALYNAMQLAGNPQSLQRIVNEVLWVHGTLFFGAFGAAPVSMESYLTAHDMEYTGYDNVTALQEHVSEGSVIVFTKLNKKGNSFVGWHAMTALYTQGKYIVFNRYNDRNQTWDYSSLEEACSEGRWFYGFLLN